VLFVIGLAMLAFGAGWMLGHRQAARHQRFPDPGSPGI
jgi:hypothetical protein